MTKPKRKREPKTPMPPAACGEALEAEIIEVMSDWPAEMTHDHGGHRGRALVAAQA